MEFAPTADSSPDVVLDWLHEQGWSIGHALQGKVWTVSATRGTHQIRTEGSSLEEAWLRATEVAREHDLNRPHAVK